MTTPPDPSSPLGETGTLLSGGSVILLLLGSVCVAIVVLAWSRLLNAGAFADRRRLARAIPGPRWLVAGMAGWVLWVYGMALASQWLARSGEVSLSAAAWWSIPAYLLGLSAVAAALWSVRLPAARAGMRLSPRDVLPGLVGGAVGLPIVLAVSTLAFVAAGLLARFTETAPPDAVAHGTLRQILDAHAQAGLSWWALPVVLQVVVLAPLLEETLYRGCLQSALVSATGRTWASIAAASVLFALVHAWSVPWHAMPTLFAVGAVCGVAFERTGRLGAPILIHAAFNALNLCLALATAG